MEIVIAPTSQDAALEVADRFDAALRAAGDSGITLGLATGSSPVAAYRELIRRHREEGLSFADARAFLLDEYVGLPRTHEESYYRFIRENFTAHVDLPDDLVMSPDGEAEDVDAAARDYDLSIREAGGVDLQILGIGSNGHIGFNEPTSSLGSRTRVKTLTRSTVEDNARFFEDAEDVPVHVITQGLATILESRRIVLIATGVGKSRAVAAMVEGPVSAYIPASILQMHPDVTVVLDEDAASQLENTDYYRFIQETIELRGGRSVR